MNCKRKNNTKKSQKMEADNNAFDSVNPTLEPAMDECDCCEQTVDKADLEGIAFAHICSDCLDTYGQDKAFDLAVINELRDKKPYKVEGDMEPPKEGVIKLADQVWNWTKDLPFEVEVALDEYPEPSFLPTYKTVSDWCVYVWTEGTELFIWKLQGRGEAYWVETKKEGGKQEVSREWLMVTLFKHRLSKVA